MFFSWSYSINFYFGLIAFYLTIQIRTSSITRILSLSTFCITPSLFLLLLLSDCYTIFRFRPCTNSVIISSPLCSWKSKHICVVLAFLCSAEKQMKDWGCFNLRWWHYPLSKKHPTQTNLWPFPFPSPKAVQANDSPRKGCAPIWYGAGLKQVGYTGSRCAFGVRTARADIAVLPWGIRNTIKT